MRSTSIRSVGHDPARKWLDIEFQSGAVYRYFDVTDDIHERLVHAGSIGQFVNSHIKPCFRCQQLKGPRLSETTS